MNRAIRQSYQASKRDLCQTPVWLIGQRIHGPYFVDYDMMSRLCQYIHIRASQKRIFLGVICMSGCVIKLVIGSISGVISADREHKVL